jgi:membrane-bound lytic murein transglycosylase B
VRSFLLLLVGLLALSPAPFLLRASATPRQDTAQQQAQTPEASSTAVEASQPFQDWLNELLTEAKGRGFSDALLQETLVGLEPLTRVIASDRSQAELNPGFERYASARLTRQRITAGKELIRTNDDLLERIEKAYGIQPRFLIAFWGLESNYGRLTGRIPVFQALATLAWEPRRATLFRGELFQALMMVDRGFIEAPTMTGSWAGAMGQPQFMPSSYMQYAVDFDGDKRRDIWKSTPDALASMANYLKGFGWNGTQTWGREVKVAPAALEKISKQIPKRTDGCYARRNMTERRPLSEWRELGVRQRDGSPLPNANLEAGLVDVGQRKFLVYPNYDVILSYNCAHYYALTVGLLGDSLQGPTNVGTTKSATTKSGTTKNTKVTKASKTTK